MTQMKPVSRQVPFGDHFDYPADLPPTPYEQDRRDLLARYTHFARERGHEITSYLIQPAGSQEQLVVELFDATTSQLVVTCATLQRDNGGSGVWYAIGTLTDRARFLPPHVHNVLVLPAEPNSDLDDLLALRSITPMWPVDGNITFTHRHQQTRIN
ncbi:hypothetical protein ACFU99_24215 [Streptomyces sp. NPDC057654]|uniref:hypothetical protein n=1 Tax=Streptomyces sp. NPDC057654 TaxID=3346196 RepID=UPI00368E88F6